MPSLSVPEPAISRWVRPGCWMPSWKFQLSGYALRIGSVFGSQYGLRSKTSDLPGL